ncbi:diguanylate cyclase (GGDEF) domain-containing protein [Spongiibacter sp. IMCC21906]|uniref:sensor domain-containing protein n=1 Tax=Spongiibacter sp. IMCC21906 TaxID=1620392 RepID=UPI00062DDD7D|nr:EAL domain-containing protein [Spongiibacter sp. IMCC21906]AKH68131.1 diguanylate cyclase (GGDEF) domain-containing protein [Spongiibacter sp. IMCC21906]
MGFLVFALTVSTGIALAGAAYLLPLKTLSSEQQALAGVVVSLFLSLIGVAIYLQRQSRQLQSARKHSRYLEQLLEQGSTAIMLVNRQFKITYCNCCFAEMIQLDIKTLYNNFNVLELGKNIPEKIQSRIQKSIDQGKSWKGELRFPVSDHDKHMLVTVTPLLDTADHWEQLLVNCEDISEHKSIADRLFIQEHYSVLTGLPNRHLAIKKLNNCAASCHNSSDVFSLAHIDIDRIRYLNDSLGHIVVDKLLNAIAERLRACIGDEQILAHVGADEFLLLLSEGSSLGEAMAISDVILDDIKRPFYIDNNEINLTASIGLTQFPSDGSDAASLLRSAEAAMFAAKEEGGNRYCVFDETMSFRVEQRMLTENHLRHAIEREELSLHYQPVIDLKNNQLVGVEVLLRWHNDKLLNPGPDDFIHIAEDSGLIIPIGDWVLQNACQQAVQWRQSGLPPIRVAVNISSRQFKDGHIVNSVEETIKRTGMDPAMLELEITEGLLINDAPYVRECFQRLKALGVRLSIDDFGTGYASLSYLKRYPFDTLKIDKSFIHGIEASQDSVTLANAVIAMAHSFKMEVVAEGVENLQQRRILKERQCDKAQGFLYSPAIPADHFTTWAKRYQEIQAAQYI